VTYCSDETAFGVDFRPSVEDEANPIFATFRDSTLSAESHMAGQVSAIGWNSRLRKKPYRIKCRQSSRSRTVATFCRQRRHYFGDSIATFLVSKHS